MLKAVPLRKIEKKMYSPNGFQREQHRSIEASDKEFKNMVKQFEKVLTKHTLREQEQSSE